MQTLPLLSPRVSQVSKSNRFFSSKKPFPDNFRAAVAATFSLAIILYVIARNVLNGSKATSELEDRDGNNIGLPDLGPDHRIKVSNVTKLTGSDILSRSFARRIIVSERSRLIYCPIPKVASSSWKYLIRKLEGVDDYSDLSKAHSPLTSGLRYLTDYSPNEVEALVHDPSFFKFVFVRDPYVRAASCYMDKFQNRNEAYVRAEYSQFLAQLYDWRFVRSLNIDTAPRPSFAEYVDQLSMQNPMEMNEHWMPQTLLCGFGEMPYDFVGHLESLSEDAKQVLQHISKQEEHFPSQSDIGFPPSGASNGGGDEFFTLEAMAKLRLIYDVDFNLNFTIPE